MSLSQDLIQSAFFKEIDHARPGHYPFVDPYPELLFFIQASQNCNSVIYEVNKTENGLINNLDPLNIYWIKNFRDGSTSRHPINYIQRTLAYGYESEEINFELFRFRLVAYRAIWFYVNKLECGAFRAYIETPDGLVRVSHLYVHADDNGVFPQVQYAEIYGYFRLNEAPFYKRISFT
jgi:hypothetical protein